MLSKEKIQQWFPIIFVVMIMLILFFTFFNPLTPRKKLQEGEVTREIFANRVAIKSTKAMCSGAGLMKLNSCISLSQAQCFNIVGKETNKCINLNIMDLPEVIAPEQEVLTKRWIAKLARCIGRTSMHAIKVGKTIEEIACMKGVMLHED